MIKGFEKQTQPLTEFELSLIPKFVDGFNQRIGKKNAITNAEIRRRFMSVLGIKLSDARIRKIVNYIRNKHLVSVLLASSKGYWVSKDEKEINDWVTTMEKRIGSMKSTLNSVMRQQMILTQQTLIL